MQRPAHPLGDTPPETTHPDDIAATVSRFEAVRSEFYVTAAAVKDRLRSAWAELEGQRSRLWAEWDRAGRYFAQQDAALTARGAELTARERTLSEARTAADHQAAGLRREAAGLEARILHARLTVEDLERRRDQLWADLAAATPKPEDRTETAPAPQVALDRVHDGDLLTWAADLDAQERQLAQRQQALAALGESLARESAALADRREVLAEQFADLATARARWQQAEQQTVGEMEELARSLRAREQDLDAREERLIRADVRRREEGYELWQLRLRLHAWQTRLTAYAARVQEGRERIEADLVRRSRVLARREADAAEMTTRWERDRAEERSRLRAELAAWSESRAASEHEAAEYARRGQEWLAELLTHATRAMAAEQAALESAGVHGVELSVRMEALRERWKGEFARRAAEASDAWAAVTAERAALDERYRQLREAAAEVTAREAALNARLAEADAGGLTAPLAQEAGPEPDLLADETGVPVEDELTTLREEVERMAAVLLEASIPEPPDQPLPAASSEATHGPGILPFPGVNRAA